MQLSVIVPVHNTAPYLVQCFDSLINQTILDLEIIAVINGSTDNSQSIVEEYVKLYPRKIKMIVSNIADLSEARNIGLLYAHGEYIAYLDSDDYVEETMYEKMYCKAKQGDFDVVVCDIYYAYTNRKESVSSGIDEDIFIPDKKRASIIRIYPSAWNKIFRRKLVNGNIRFTPGIWFEDFEFLYRLYPAIDTIGAVKENLIYYRQREGSIVHRYDIRLYQYITNFDNILKHYHAIGQYNNYRKELEFLYVRYAYATMVKRLSKMGDRKKFNAGYVFARKSVKAHFPYYRRNSLFYKQGIKGIYLLLFGKILSLFVYIKECRIKM